MSGWDEQGRWRWGKAGSRLDEQEAEQRHRKRVAERNRAEQSRAADNARAERLYRGGRLVPARITYALDAKNLDGPEVDIQCGAAEPHVDLWEAGVLYPTWEQVQKLAELCGVTPRFLMDEDGMSGGLDARSTTLRFHVPAHELPEPPVRRFTPEAIRARLRPRPDDPEPEVVARYQPGDQVALFDPEPQR